MPGFNHYPTCTCGWCWKPGGISHSPLQASGWRRTQVSCDSYVDPNATCPVCGAEVFFFQSPFGGRVFFDELGPPWPKHPCTDNTSAPGAGPRRVSQADSTARPTPSWAMRGWIPATAVVTKRPTEGWLPAIVCRADGGWALHGHIATDAPPPVDTPLLVVPFADDGVGRISWLTPKGNYDVGKAAFEALFVDLSLTAIPRQRLAAALKGDPEAILSICDVLQVHADRPHSPGFGRLKIWLQRASAAGIARAASRLSQMEALATLAAQKEALFRRTWRAATHNGDLTLLSSTATYHAFTREFDEVVYAADLVALGQADDLAAQFLGRTAAAASADGSDQDQCPSANLRGMLVTILLDNSGSLRGPTIALMAALTHRLVDAVVACGGMVEILGFTTRTWRGGRSRKKWVEEGSPTKPGRLNELRHIIYKPGRADWTAESWRCLALLAADDLLKENIDGEALIWAYGRSLSTPAIRRRILLVSDGAPMDDSTAAVNAPDYLSDHLAYVIDAINMQGTVAVSVLGIGHNPIQSAQRSRYWGNGRITDGFRQAWELVTGNS